MTVPIAPLPPVFASQAASSGPPLWRTINVSNTPNANAYGPPTGLGAVLDASNLAAMAAGNASAPTLAVYSGQAAGQGYSGVIGSSGPNGIMYSVFQNGQLVATRAGTGTTDTAALAAQYGLVGAGSVSSRAYTGVGAAGAIGVGPVGFGTQQPGGTVGPTPGGQSVQSVFAQLSHTTAGLNWTHLFWILVILAGGYIVLSYFAGGKRR